MQQHLAQYFPESPLVKPFKYIYVYSRQWSLLSSQTCIVQWLTIALCPQRKSSRNRTALYRQIPLTPKEIWALIFIQGCTDTSTHTLLHTHKQRKREKEREREHLSTSSFNFYLFNQTNVILFSRDSRLIQILGSVWKQNAGTISILSRN